MSMFIKKTLLVLSLFLAFLGSASGQDKANASYANGVLVVNGVRYEMVSIAAGKFAMGTNSGEADENPSHLVQLEAFWLGKTEVTRGLWRALRGEKIDGSQDDKNFPQEGVSWDDCNKFIKILNDLTGGNFRLPTEAEWEYACRAGTSGNSYGDLDAIAWYAATSGAETHEVGQKQPNAWGLYDMLGNVWEYCWDGYDENYYRTSPMKNPRGRGKAELHVDRGGGSHSRAEIVRASNRSMVHPGVPYNGIGFRLAASTKELN